MLRTEETEEEVDFRPRRPPAPDAWRYMERGVAGAGDSDDLFRGVGI